MKAQIGSEIWLITGLLVLLIVFGGGFYMTMRGQEGVKDVSLLNSIKASCISLMLKDQQCEQFDWENEFTKTDYKGEKYTLKGLCEKAFPGQVLEKIKQNCKKLCNCPAESITIPSSSFPSITQPSQGKCTLAEQSFDDQGAVGDTDTVSLVLTATNCERCYISPYGNPEYLTYVSKSSESVPSDQSEISATYKCKAKGSNIDFGIQVRSDLEKGACTTADHRPQIFRKVDCDAAGAPTISISTSDKNEIEAIFTSFTESFINLKKCSNNDKCKKSIIKIECDDRSPVYIWAEYIGSDKIWLGVNTEGDDNLPAEISLNEIYGCDSKIEYGSMAPYVCDNVSSWKENDKIHVKITRPSKDCSVWKVGTVTQ